MPQEFSLGFLSEFERSEHSKLLNLFDQAWPFEMPFYKHQERANRPEKIDQCLKNKACLPSNLQGFQMAGTKEVGTSMANSTAER